VRRGSAGWRLLQVCAAAGEVQGGLGEASAAAGGGSGGGGGGGGGSGGGAERALRALARADGRARPQEAMRGWEAESVGGGGTRPGGGFDRLSVELAAASALIAAFSDASGGCQGRAHPWRVLP
jgi:hypothetical protein